MFKHKIRHFKKALSSWSRETYGDIFKQLIIRDEIVKIKKELFEEFSIGAERMVQQQARAKLKKYLHFEKVLKTKGQSTMSRGWR